MKVIEVRNLSFSYGTKCVLKDVSFDVEAGKYVAIIGHNGSGKSTIAKLLMGLLEPTPHSITEFGLELNKENIHQIRSKIGIVFQNPDNQFVGSTVRDDIAFGLENRRVPHDKMDEIIQQFSSKVNMLEYLDKEPEKLSGGQKQRVAIAGVLSMNPDVIIFDEATSMLDPKGKKEIRETIDLLRKEKPSLTILSITHDIEEAYLADEVIALKKGEVIFAGNPQELLTDEQKMNDVGLSAPFIVKLKMLLEKENIHVESSSLEGIVNELCK